MFIKIKNIFHNLPQILRNVVNIEVENIMLCVVDDMFLRERLNFGEVASVLIGNSGRAA